MLLGPRLGVSSMVALIVAGYSGPETSIAAAGAAAAMMTDVGV